MKLIRSWPQQPPTKNHHPYVVDNCNRVCIPTIDYSPLLDVGDDLIHLDWDVAVGKHEIQAFAKKCLAEPEDIRVAPVMMYGSRFYKDDGLSPGRWQDKYMECVQMPVGKRPVQPGDPYCNYFSFSLIYFPYWTLKGFVDSLRPGEQFRDGNFNEWYGRTTNWRPVPLEWDAHVVHTNYSIKDALEGLDL
jgi:hypothetical protein